jgi:hypothetical protein
MAGGARGPAIQDWTLEQMKNFYILLFLSSLGIFGACSSSDPGTNSAGNNSNMPVNRIDTVNINGQNANVNAFNPIGVNANLKASNIQVLTPGKANMSRMGKAAPDNSEMFAELGEVPIETRVFKNHPQLIKVVKSGIPPNQTIKVYLKGGKTVDLPGNKIANLGIEPAASILQAAGVQPAAPPAGSRDPSKKTDQK